MSSARLAFRVIHTRGAKVYTKTGDKGTSMLFSGERRAKSDPVFTALGDTDELNGVVGVAREYCLISPSLSSSALPARLQEIQSRLMDVGAAVATPISSSPDSKLKRGLFPTAAESTAQVSEYSVSLVIHTNLP